MTDERRDTIEAVTIETMFERLTDSYTVDETVEILLAKYPNSKSKIEEMSIKMNDKPEAEETDVPVVEKEAEKTDAEKLAKAVDKKTKPPKKAKPPKEKKVTKASRARVLYADAVDKSRKAMIALFTKELDMSPSAASTYFYTCKKDAA